MQRVLDAAKKHGWKVRRRGRFRAWLSRDEYGIDLAYDLSRHTKGRAYRGNALSAIFHSQREVINYLEVRP